MRPGKFVALLQDCYVESRHGGQVLSSGLASKGESIELLSGNRFHTVVKPRLLWEDEQANDFPDATPDQIRAADERMRRAANEGFMAVYGPCYEGEPEFPG